MRPYYECHITFMMPGGRAAPDTIAYLEKVTGWRFSQIDGDPVLGAGLKSYLTKHYPASTNTSHAAAEADRVVVQMDKIAGKIRGMEMQVTRQKVELVLFDTKSDSEIKQ